MPLAKSVPTNLIRARVTATYNNGDKVVGILLSQLYDSICLLVEGSSVTINKNELSEVTEASYKHISTDAEIAQKGKSTAGSKGNTDNKYLSTTFVFDENDSYLPELELSKVRPMLKIDQFARNEQLTGLKSKYDFNSYTIDVSAKSGRKKGSTTNAGFLRGSLRPSLPSYAPGDYIPPSMRQPASTSKEVPATAHVADEEKEQSTQDNQHTSESASQVPVEVDSTFSSFTNCQTTQQEETQTLEKTNPGVLMFSSNPDKSQLSLNQFNDNLTSQAAPRSFISFCTNRDNIKITAQLINTMPQAPSFSDTPSFSSMPSNFATPAPVPASVCMSKAVTLNNYSQNISPTSPSMGLLTLAVPEGN